MSGDEPITFRVRLLGEDEADRWTRQGSQRLLMVVGVLILAEALLYGLTQMSGFSESCGLPALLLILVPLIIYVLPLGEPGKLHVESEALVFVSNYRERRLTIPFSDLRQVSRDRRLLEIQKARDVRHWLLCHWLQAEDVFDQIQDALESNGASSPVEE